MKKIVLVFSVVTLIGACGTARGVVSGTGSLANGVGSVLEGMSRDARSVGGWLE